MPLVDISLVGGRPPEKLRRLITAVTEAVHDALGVAQSDVRVLLRELPAEHWAAGDETIAERRQARQDR